MRDYSIELQGIKEFFKKSGVGLNSAQELLYMLLGILNEDGTDFTDNLVKRVGYINGDIDAFIEEYTIEVGTIMQYILQDLGNSMNDEIDKNELLESMGKEISVFLTLEKKAFLKEIVTLYQKEFAKLIKSKYYKDMAKNMLDMMESNSQLVGLEIKKIETMDEKNLTIVVSLLLQDIFNCMSIFHMQAMLDGEIPEVFSQEEYEEDGFDIREKLSEVVEQSQDMIFNEDEFYFSTDDKPICTVCKKHFSTSGLQRHVGTCIKKNIADENVTTTLYQFKIYDKYMPDFFLHVLVSKKAKLFHLDRFLREIWLECCGHMSGFRANREEIDMGEPIEVLSEYKKVDYTYDYGSSTDLVIEFKKEYKGKQDYYIKLLARNSEFKEKCHRCHKKSAKFICTECVHNREALFCKSCVKKHTKEYHDGEEYMISNFVNSPRTGVCAYGAIEEEI